MEGGDHDQSQLGNGGGSRWNPTKEQINMLESLYKQGLRTPSAEQIQQITNRLRAFGHIEGKNVFYWFQNHKARQRQKQKQENLAYFNRFIHAASTTPAVFPTYQNVICSPCYINPPSKNHHHHHHHHPGFYQQYPKVAQLPTAPAGFKRTKLIETIHDHHQSNKQQQQHPTSTHMYNQSMHDHPGSTRDHETLDLFPIHPTGLLQSRNIEDGGVAAAGSCNGSSGNIHHEQLFFDFFCGNNNN